MAAKVMGSLRVFRMMMVRRARARLSAARAAAASRSWRVLAAFDQAIGSDPGVGSGDHFGTGMCSAPGTIIQKVIVRCCLLSQPENESDARVAGLLSRFVLIRQRPGGAISAATEPPASAYIWQRAAHALQARKTGETRYLQDGQLSRDLPDRNDQAPPGSYQE
jgi:hypothetical protein